MGKNLSFKKIGKQILSINNLIESYFNKLRSFISNPKKFQFTRDNRVIFVFAGIVFLTLAYFLVPTAYNKDLIQKVKIEISKQLKELPRVSIAKKSLISNGILIHINSDKKIAEVINKIAPEHLELNVKNYKSFIPKIKNAGSICLGKYAVMAMTDYNVGSNHVLPTNSSAKYSSGISVNEFYKRISYINLSKKGIESLGPSVITLANYEGLAGHAQSVKKRIRRK